MVLILKTIRNCPLLNRNSLSGLSLIKVNMDCKLIISLGFLESYLCKYVSKPEKTNVNLVTVLTYLLNPQNGTLMTISLSIILRNVLNHNTVRTINNQE